jgi:hypothetical protein
MGSREQALIRVFPNGETHFQFSLMRVRSCEGMDWHQCGLIEVFVSEYIGYKGEPGELKHLSTRRKGHQRDSVSSGERTRTRPVLMFV